MSMLGSTCAAMVAASSLVSAYQQMEKRVEYGAFSIMTPRGFVITKSTPVGDFDIYDVTNKNRLFVRIYVGNAPTYPTRNENKYEVTESKLGNVEITSRWRDNRLKGREMKVRLSAELVWPTFLHILTGRDLNDEEVRIADKVMSSIQTNKKEK